MGTGGGGFPAPVSFAVGTRPLFIALADYDRDGWLDFITGNRLGRSVSLLPNTACAATGVVVATPAGLSGSLRVSPNARRGEA